MKHFVLTLLGLLSFCLAIRAEVYSGECGDNGNNLTWTLDTETGKLVISGNGAMTQNPWRDYRNYIRIVDIQEGVTSIVSDAFADCSNLTNVIIAESVTTINYYAFYNCKSLNNITIPDNVTYIGSSAFQGCTNLSNITIACTTIASYAFQECTNLKKVTIKNGVKEIKKGAFDNCTSIEKVIVEDGEETLTLGAGGGYNKGLFHNSPIKNLYIGRNLEYNTTSDYGYSPFYALRTIVSLNIGSQVSLLKDNAFNYCTNLNSITCLNSNPPICGTNTFTSVNTSTCKLSVPKSSINTYKSTNPWSDFKNIVESKVISGTCGTNLTWELTPMGELIIEGKGDMSNFKDYDTPWFDYRASIEKVCISEGVTSIGDWAFYNCNNIESIDLSKDLTHIGNYAFRNCALISTISLPEKLSSIGDGAFDGCSGLTSVTIPNSVTNIGYGAFLSCSGLTSVTIGSGVKTIGSKIFDNCQKLLDVYCLAEKVPSTDSYAFSSSIYSNATLHVPAGSVATYKTTDPWRSFGNIVALASFSGEVEIDGINYDLVAKVKQATVIKKSGGKYSGEVVIPESVEHEGAAYSVTSIGKSAFYSCSGLTSVTIPNSVTSIGDYAFRFCYGLTSVIIPNSVTSIGDYAFHECSGLTSVTIPNSVMSIGGSAFYRCYGLTSVTIGNGVKSIGDYAFARCPELLDVYCYAENVPITSSYAFEHLPLASTLHVLAASIDSYKATAPWSSFGKIVTISAEVEIDGINYELNGETKQAAVIKKSSGKYSGEVVIPESVEHEGAAYSVTSIGDYAFQNCSGLTSVTIPNSVTSIGESAFRACSGLTSLTIPNSVTSIGGYAFYGCTSLFNITIPSGISKIENHTFVDCISLTRITIPDNITEIGEYAFRGCRKINKLLIGNSVNSILTNAFEYCSGLTLLVLPKSLRWVSSNVFHGCTNLKTVINFSSETPKRGEIDCGYAGYYAERIANRSDGNMYLDGDFVFNRTNSGNELLAYLGSDSYITLPDWSNNGDESYSISGGIFKNDKTVISITVPKSVIGIGSEAFYGCSGLTSVTIPNSVTSIGDYTFYDCSGLTSVTIPNSVENIGHAAFYGCSGLTSVTIGSGVQFIGIEAFGKCNELLNVFCYAEDVPSTIDGNVFYLSPIESATLHVPAASIESYKTTEPWSSFCNIVALPNQYELSVSSAGYATLCLSFNAEIPQDVEVYVAEKVDGDCLKMKKVEGVLPAMTGVIVKAETGTYAFIQSEDTSAEIGENLLVGSVIEKEITAEENTSYYILAAPDDNVGMYLVEMVDGAFVCKANKAYLPISSSGSSAPARIRFDFGTETGVSEVKGENENVKTEIYDLSGRKVKNAQKGIFIVNGKKVVK